MATQINAVANPPAGDSLDSIFQLLALTAVVERRSRRGPVRPGGATRRFVRVELEGYTAVALFRTGDTKEAPQAAVVRFVV
jgi:hypothetical protein